MSINDHQEAAMYAWIMDFNLRGSGEAAERFLISMIREWPPRYEKVSGVIGVSFFGNAFGLAGEHSFRMVVDMKSLDTLSAIDKMFKSDAGARRAMNEFRGTRSDIKSRLLKQQDGGDVISQTVNKASDPGFVYAFTASPKTDVDTLRKAKMGSRKQAIYAPIVQSAAAQGPETWATVTGLDDLEDVALVANKIGSESSQLFASFRVVDGSLLSAA
ncbi:hypothetical protein [Rhizobium laguerreae]|uniref:hypothetical protein n=1 Tax=Rhizobium laguerreae TaxID=1076926 RepID=UPI001C9298AE|nr:hypothetical protein [Rhizobium laguerreae]MBY3203465.1 hypothetical protein [Rhizobium laguerreae]